MDYFQSIDTFYKTVSEISVSNENEQPSETNSCIYNNDIYMICLDDVVINCTKDGIKKSRIKCENCRIKGECIANFQHSSVDSIHIKFNKGNCHFYLFEFKKYNIKDPISSYELKKLEKIKNTLNESLYEKLRKKLRRADTCSLKLKAYESVYSIIPQMYIEYCLKKNIPFDFKEDIENLKSFLFNCKFFYSTANFHFI
ncbi:MAG: hypothetical protein LBC39_07385 [Methanobrevibacter sp.]|jgi:hypothetical protein|nr:hypothetical protein [Candidatus Methanovirga aequatorialis]